MNPETATTDWHAEFIVEGATEKQTQRIVDAFVAAVEKEGLTCGGGVHPAGVCDGCSELDAEDSEDDAVSDDDDEESEGEANAH